MAESNRKAHDQAKEMIRLFQSVGATRFAVTWTDSAGDPVRKTGKDGEERIRFWSDASPILLSRYIPEILDEATHNRHNIVVRPGGPPEMTFLQLDDLDAEKLARLAPPCFWCSKPRPETCRRGWRSKPRPIRISCGA